MTTPLNKINRRNGSKKAQAQAQGKCAAKTRMGGTCGRPAGWGTAHVGFGKCKYHGGNTHNARKAGIVHDAIIFMGAPKEITPIDAIIWCIHITAGEVEWLSLQIAEINDQGEWYEHTVMGRQMHVLQRTRAEAQDRLVRYSKDALTLGLAERAVRIAEQYGATLAKLLEGIRDDMLLTDKQKDRWAIVVRKHLILLQGGNVMETNIAKEPLAAVPIRNRREKSPI